MGAMSAVHWVAVLLVVVLVFGTKKLGNIGADLGKAVKGFKDGVKGEAVHAGDDCAACTTEAAGHLSDSAPIHTISFNDVNSHNVKQEIDKA